MALPKRRVMEADKTSILLVDDHAENLLALEAVLEPLGQRIVSVSSGERALARTLEENFALILLDIAMPGMDGFEVSRYLKRHLRTRSIPIIFLPAVGTDPAQVLEGYASGAVDYIVKPFDPDALRAKAAVFLELHRNKLALSRSEMLFRTAFDNAPIGMALIDLDGRYRAVNRSLSSITGYSEKELLELRWTEITHPEDIEGDSEYARRLVAGEIASAQTEKRYLHASGGVIWATVGVALIRDGHGRPLYFISQIEDISARKRAEELLTHQALHDALTRLPNRGLFMDRLASALARLQRRHSYVGVLFMDLDRFKVINDSLGHDCGDELIVRVGERLRKVLRPADTVARMGGDEFTIVCEDVRGEQDVTAVARRVSKAIAEPFILKDREILITTSIGIVMTDRFDADASAMLRNADAAMYHAKEQGSSLYRMFDEGMHKRSLERLSIEQGLHRSLEREELHLVYQPMVRLDTGDVLGVEALVRWAHPELGVLEPGRILPVAEDTGQIVSIDDWVLRRTLQQMARWHEADVAHENLKVAINLSAAQFIRGDLARVVAKGLARWDLNPATLCLEITERTLMNEPELSAKTLRELKSVGVTISVDDFGIGYSSLAYLKAFEVDILKLNPSLTKGLGQDTHSETVFDAIAGLAGALGVVVVAQGIETAKQLQGLRHLGSLYGQGFYFAHPRRADDIIELLDQTPMALLP